MTPNPFADRLISWYLTCGRDLPWRNTRDPYPIWISEIILQQTRVAQGLEYYHRFLQRFPTLKDLAQASEDEVLLMWQGLGYYSRARNIHQAAKSILADHKGIFPKDYASVIKLKGIGEYTASAICSFAFGQAHMAIDGNAYRVFSRFFAVDLPIDLPAGQKIIKELALGVFDPKRPDLFNQAVMDLGSGICTPRQAKCEDCPLQQDCLAWLSGKTQTLPCKQGKVRQKDRFLTYFVFVFSGITYLYKRPKGDVWQGLYEFPMLESANKAKWDDLNTYCEHHFPLRQLRQTDTYLHILSHQRIHARFYIIPQDALDSGLLRSLAPPCEPVTLDRWENFPISRLMERFCETENFLSILESTRDL